MVVGCRDGFLVERVLLVVSTLLPEPPDEVMVLDTWRGMSAMMVVMMMMRMMMVVMMVVTMMMRMMMQ